MREHKEMLSKYLRILFYIQIASVAITLINSVSNLDSITRWVSKALSLAAIWSLFRLKAVNPRYKTAAITNAVVFVCGLLTLPVNTSGLGLSWILLLVGAGCSWIAAYQEYHGHSELTAQWDEKLAKKWRHLFVWEIVCGLAVSFLTTAVTTVLIVADAPGKLPTTITIVISTAVGLVMDLLYLIYMKQTLALIEV